MVPNKSNLDKNTRFRIFKNNYKYVQKFKEFIDRHE